LLVLSADTPTALDAVTAKLAARLRADSSLPLADVAYTLAVGRKALRFRRALVVRSIADAITALENADAFTDAAAPDGRKTIHEALASLDLEASSAEAATILEQAGQRWAKGAPVDLSTLFEGQRRRRLDLPTYPFEPRRFALDSRSDAATGRSRSATPLAAGAAEMERDLAALWREVLDLREANADQDFFDAGGDSLSAVRLFDRIRGRFGVDLPLATLFEARTLAAMSGLLRDRLAGRPPAAPGAWRREATAQPARPAAPRSLVAVQPGSGGPPLFIVHGAAGHVLNVTDLARALGPAQAVFGLQAVGIDGLSAPRATIEEMARAYLGEIRVVQPHGPYLLAGYSGGGTVAFEMARQLDAAREAIGLLALIDTFHPQMPHPRITALSRLERLGRERISYVRDGLARLLVSRREARDVRQIHQHLAAGELVPPALRELHLTRSFVAAADRYAPAPWPGRALLFKAEQVDYYHRAGGPAYGWDATITGGLEVVAIPGDHRSILIGANASRIARRLEQAIEQIPAPVITGAGR
jgi:thioesterase domain-containing protein/acyl carrier protein